MSIKKVLMISYLFPPLDCGVGRQIKFAKYLPLFGWTPTVLTVNKSILRPKYDYSIMKEVSPSVEVFRTYSLEIRPLQRWLPAVLNRLLGVNPKWFQPVDTFIGWLPFAMRKGLETLKEGNIDLVFSTSPPNTCHLVAFILKKKFGIPWIADFRDLWTQNPYVTYPGPILKVEEKIERRVIENADRIITLTEPMANSFVERYSDQPKEKFLTISHGFDLDDFKNLKAGNQKFTMTYTGSIYGFRKHVADVFLDAMNKVLSENPNLREELEVKFVGSVESIRSSVSSRNLDGVVKLLEYTSHVEAIRHMMASHVLLLITGVRHRVSNRFKKAPDEMSGKIVEYIVVGKPILALSSDISSAAKIVISTGTGVVVDPSDQEGMVKAVQRFFRLYKENSLKIKPNTQQIKKYDVRMLTKKLSEIFDSVIQA
jgi:glycosyltransferase involved in cell wall biosynthesis